MKQLKKNYDFAGWVTKNDILCADGVVIKQGAFANSNRKVPLVWNHKHDDVGQVLGHMILEHRDIGTYGYGYFGNTDPAKNAKQMVKDGSIVAMSIAANHIKKQGQDVIHGNIFEVSLVLAGANPGALIQEVITHSSYGDEEPVSIFNNGLLIHSIDDIILEEDSEEMDKKTEEVIKHASEDKELDYEKIYESLNDEQRAMFDELVAVLEEETKEKPEEEPKEETMKQSAFDNNEVKEQVLTHSDIDSFVLEAKNEGGSLKETFLKHGVNNVEMLFPQAQLTTAEPIPYRANQLGTTEILSGVKKSPMTRLKSRFANLTEAQARGRGYIKSDQKLDSVIDFMSRETSPQTVYVKQTIDRDDVIDITDFNIVTYLQRELRNDLEDEIARAILVGDGREKTDRNKIRTDKIRPISEESEFFKINKTAATLADIFAASLLAKAEYRGSGAPTAFIHPELVVAIKLLKDSTGRFLNGHVMTDTEVASALNVSRIVETVLVPNNEILIMNLNDYTVGTDKGGQITSFDDFDIDFNQNKYLIETRLSGATMTPKSIIHIKVTNVGNISGVTTTDTHGFDKLAAGEQALAAKTTEFDAEAKKHLTDKTQR